MTTVTMRDDHYPDAVLPVDAEFTQQYVLALPPRMDFSRRHKPERGRDPTPTQIAAACLRIQATWDAATRESRCVYKRQPVEVRELSPIDPDDDAEDE
jgi:hypothetical protein